MTIDFFNLTTQCHLAVGIWRCIKVWRIRGRDSRHSILF